MAKEGPEFKEQFGKSGGASFGKGKGADGKKGGRHGKSKGKGYKK